MRFKAPLIILGLYIILISLSGCETIKGAVKGAATGGSEGFSKDWNSVKRMDDWFRENLW